MYTRCRVETAAEMQRVYPCVLRLREFVNCQPTSISWRSFSFASISGHLAWHCSQANSTYSLLDPCNQPRFFAQLQQYNIVVSPLRSTSTLTSTRFLLSVLTTFHPAHSTKTHRQMSGSSSGSPKPARTPQSLQP